jgi:succinate dehydrogenase/fumarate reductase cytochrome b subunit
MNDASIKVFTDVLGASPLKVATIFVVILIFFLGLAIIRVIKNGLTEVQEKEDFDHSDYMFVIIRILAVFLIVSIFFGI